MVTNMIYKRNVTVGITIEYIPYVEIDEKGEVKNIV